jgi:anti-anti-sigma factor
MNIRFIPLPRVSRLDYFPRDLRSNAQMAAELTVTVDGTTGEALVARIQGEAGVANSPTLERELTRIIARHPKLLVLDVSGMTFISSLAMSYLVHLNRGVKSHGGAVRVAGASPTIITALKRCKLDELFQFFDTPDAAIAV